MANLEYKTEEIPYTDHKRLIEIKIELNENSKFFSSYVNDPLVRDENGRIWEIEARLYFNEMDITVEVSPSQVSNQQFEYEYKKFESVSKFEKWLEEGDFQLVD